MYELPAVQPTPSRHSRHRRPARERRQPGVEQLERRELLDTGLASSLGLASSSRLLTAAYNDLLKRAPQPAELTQWQSAVQSGQNMAQVFLLSPEYHTEYIKDTYTTLLKREAQPAEVNSWLQATQAGLSEEGLTAKFLASDEYYQEKGGTAETWLTGLYWDLFQRAPDATGFFLWREGLQNGASRETVALGFIKSPEASTQFVTASYQQLLGRAPDASGQATWIGALNAGLTRSDVMAAIMGSAEYIQIHTDSSTGNISVPAASGSSNTATSSGSVSSTQGSSDSPASPADQTNMASGTLTPSSTVGLIVAVHGAPTTAVNIPVTMISTVTDPNPGATPASLHYAWSVTGNGSVFASSTTPNFTFTPNTSGTYVATLTVTDNLHATGSTSKTISVAGSSASNVIVRAGANITTKEGTPVSFAGTATGGKGPYSYAWDFGDGTRASGTLTPTHTYANSGAYTVTLTVTDAQNRVGQSTLRATVQDMAPTVAINGAPTTWPAGWHISLSSTVTSPSPVDTAAGFTYNWTVTKDGAPFTSATTPNLIFNPLTAGTYVVTLTAIDKDNASGTATKTITVTGSISTPPVSNPPVSNPPTSSPPTSNPPTSNPPISTPPSSGSLAVTINGAPASGAEGTPIAMTSTVSSSNPADTAAGFSYTWTVTKDGTSFASGTSASFSFTPADDGTYVVTLVATAQDKTTGTASKTITVADAGPTANANGPYSGTAGTPITFKGTAIDPSPTDTAAGFTYQWSFGDNSTSNQATASHTYATAGTYTVTLVVTDKDGTSNTVRTTATVIAAPLQPPTQPPTTPAPQPTQPPAPPPSQPAPPPATGAFITTPYDKIPNFGANPTIVSASSGAWSSASTWSSGRVPGAGDVVSIAANTTVTYDVVSDAVVNTVIVQSGGHLIFRTDVNTRLTLLNFLVLDGGELQIGTASNPVAPTVKAEVVFADQPIDTTADPAQYGHGLIALGKVTMYGAVKNQTFVELATEPKAGDTTLTLKQPVTGWQAGDKLLLPDSQQRTWTQVFGNYVPEWEQVTLASISADGTVLTLSAPLQFSHPGARDASGVLDFLPHVADRSGNVMIHSQNPSGTRGYVMFTGRADVNIQNAQFLGLGRTKIDAFDNTTFDANGNVTHIGTNQQGRYPVTFNHLIGPSTIPADGYQYTFSNNVVLCPLTPMPFRWGIDIDGSDYGLISGNVIYNWAGAGIMTEQGNESFNVIQNNFVMRVNGIGLRADYPQDFGTEGAGLWIQGPNNYVRNNVVTDVTGPQVYTYGYVLYFGNTGTMAVPAYQGADPSVPGQSIMVNMNATPILEFSGNEAYGVESGLTYWEVGCTNGVPNPVGQSVIKDFKLWAFFNLGIFGYQSNNLTIDGFVARGDNALLQSGSGATGFYGGDYVQKNLVITNADLQSLYIGIFASSSSGGGTQTFQNSYFRNYIDIQVATLSTSNYRADDPNLMPRVIHIDNDKFDTSNIPSLGGAAPTTIQMDYKGAGFVWNFVQSDQVFVQNYNQVAGDNFQVYYTQQDANFILPQTTYNSDGTPSLLGAPVANLTNAQAWQQYRVAIAGAVAPSTAQKRTGIDGLINPM